MRRSLLDAYRCPARHERLALEDSDGEEEIEKAELVAASGARYAVRAGVPVLVPAQGLTEEELQTQVDYDESASEKYDAAVDWQFRVFYEDEDEVREGMVDLLQLAPDAKVLEIGCGTGRDSFRIARRLGAAGPSSSKTSPSRWS